MQEFPKRRSMPSPVSVFPKRRRAIISSLHMLEMLDGALR